MSEVVISVENLSKQYRLGLVGTGTMTHDLNRFWHKIRGKEDPYLKIGGINDRAIKTNDDYIWALKEVNFEVKQGEVLGIIGKNGAGKSTLLKLLSRITSPTTGSIKIKGRIASLLEVGTGFHPELTGRENIFLNGAILGMTKSEIGSKLDEIIDFSGCAKYVDTPVKRYSSGMMVRLGFAVAAHLEPEVLVVDEVLAVGDAEFQKKCIGKMKEVSGQGRTVLFVSHNMGSIQALCSRSLYLENGGLMFQGNVNEAISLYYRDTLLHDAHNADLRSIKNRFGSGEGFFSKISFFNKNADIHRQFFFKEQFKIEFEIEMKKSIPNLIIWLIICDAFGNKILLAESSDDIFAFESLEIGTSTYEVVINENLIPGTYYISLGLYTDKGMAVDYLERIISFSVLKETINNNGYYRWSNSHGNIYSDSKWKKVIYEN